MRRPCLTCGEPSQDSYCPAHREPKKTNPIHGTQRWRRLSKRLRRMQPFCTECGSTERLQVDHIDGDPTNNVLENLRVLCEPCHARTETYGPRKT